MFTQVGRSYETSKADCNEIKPAAPPSYIVDSSSPLSSVSIPSPPSVSPTPEMYNKEHLYQSVSQLKVQNHSNDGSGMNVPNNVSLMNTGVITSIPHTNGMPPHEYIGINDGERGEFHIMDVKKSVQDLKHFLLTAPSQFRNTDIIHQFRLPTEEQISCVRWNNAFCITGTDIVRILAYRFSLFGRDIVNRKKFEEGIFSDLRNLKINVDATLENPKSELLEFLYKRHCVRTKKKQKVFFWYSVRHDQLFIDALERELKKDAVANGGIAPGTQPAGSSSASTVSLREPAISFKYDTSLPLVEQLRGSCDSMAPSYANLVSEITTSTISTDYSPCQANYGNLKGKGVRDNMAVGVTNTPSTPVQQSVDNYNLDVSLMLTPYEKIPHLTRDKQDLNGSVYSNENQSLRAQQNFYQPAQNSYSNFVGQQQQMASDSQNALQNGYFKGVLYQTPPRDTSVRPLEPMPVDSSSLTDSSKQHCSPHRGNIKYSDDLDTSDFPLDVLIKEHESSVRYSDLNSSFENKYTDFAHHNRPALTFQNTNNTLLLNDGPVSSMLQAEQSNNVYPAQGYSLLGSGTELGSSLFPPQSPDWDQYIYSDSANSGLAKYSDPSLIQPTPEAQTTSVVCDEATPYPFGGESTISGSHDNKREPLVSKYFANTKVTKQYPTRKKGAHGAYLHSIADDY